MNKTKILSLMAFIIFITPALLALTGCPLHTDTLYGLKVTGDGVGGAIALYEDKPGGHPFVQKVSPDGKVLWGDKGVLLGESDSKTNIFTAINVISDGSGGAIVVWPEPSQNQFRPTSHLARISGDGTKLWQLDFIYFTQLVSYGSGGAVIAFDYSAGEHIIGDEKNDLVLVKVDARGDYPWCLQGVSVPCQRYHYNTLQIISDESGGVIVVWQEGTSSIGRILTQRINSKGELSRGQGVLLYTTPDSTYMEGTQIVGDGSGGVIVGWQQVPNGRMEGGSPEANLMDILVQKVNAEGRVIWQYNGLPLKINETAGNAFPIEPGIVSDGSGGVIIVWRDSRSTGGNQAAIYAQKVSGDGNRMWQPGGNKVSINALNPNHMIIGDGAGGALVSYFFSEPRKDLHIQKIGADGNLSWPENGISIGGGDYAGYAIAADGQGGTIIGWGIGKALFSPAKALAQRVDADGKLLWGKEGIRLNP